MNTKESIEPLILEIIKKAIEKKISWSVVKVLHPPHGESWFIEGRYAEKGHEYALKTKIPIEIQQEVIIDLLGLGSAYRQGLININQENQT